MLMYADDTLLVEESEEGLQAVMNVFSRVCERRKVCINEGKSKVMRMGEGGNIQNMEIRLGVVVVGQVDNYKYLGININANGDMKEEMCCRIRGGRSARGGGVREVWKKGRMTMERKRRIYESVVVPKVMYGSELWVLSAKERKAIEVFEMKGLRSMCGIRVSDRIRNERIRERCRWERGLVVKCEQSILR